MEVVELEELISGSLENRVAGVLKSIGLSGRGYLVRRLTEESGEPECGLGIYLEGKGLAFVIPAGEIYWDDQNSIWDSMST